MVEKLLIKRPEELNSLELIRIFQARVAVFVVEQSCAYQEVDELDERAIHIWFSRDEAIVAYTRVIVYESYVSFGRVLVTEDYRGEGYGRKIVAEALHYITTFFPEKRIEISAQAYLEKFYKTFGFESMSEIYLEDDIPHISMSIEK